MNNNIRLGLLAVSTIAVLSLAACKTTDEATQDSTPPPAPEAAPAPQPAPTDTSTMPMPTSSTTPTDTSTTPPTTP